MSETEQSFQPRMLEPRLDYVALDTSDPLARRRSQANTRLSSSSVGSLDLARVQVAGSSSNLGPMPVSSETMEDLQQKVSVLVKAVIAERKLRLVETQQKSELAETVRSLQSSLDDKMKSLKKVIDEKLRLNEEVSDLRESNKRLSIAASSMPMTAPGSPLRRQTSAGDDDHDFSDTASISGKSTSAARSLATNPSSSKVKKGRALEEDFKILTNDLRTAQHTILDLEEQLKTKEKVIADQRQVAEQKSMIFESEVRVLESSKAKAVFQLRVLDEEHRRLTRDNETLSEEKRRATLEAQGYKKQYEETAASLADAEKRAEMLGADCETLQYDLKEKTAACEALAARLVDMKKQLANVSVQLASFAVRKIHRLLPSTEAQLIVQEKPSGGILVDVFAFGRHHVEDMGTVVEVRAHRDKITILYSHREPDLLEADNCEDIVKCLQGLMMKASS